MRTIEALCGEMEAPHGRVGVIGFSMGGHWAPWLAQRPELPMAATVTLYAARNGDYESSASAFLAQL
jgi:dienelactone hydrolase